MKNTPETRNSGRFSTVQMFFQVGKKPKSTQLSVPTPRPSAAAMLTARTTRPGSKLTATSSTMDDAREEHHHHQAHGHDLEEELGEDRVEQGDDRIVQQPAIGAHHVRDPARDVAVEKERDDPGGVEEQEARADRRHAEREAEGHRQQDDPAERLGDRPEVAAHRAPEHRAHLAHHQREKHPQPLQRHGSGRDGEAGGRDRSASISTPRRRRPRRGICFHGGQGVNRDPEHDKAGGRPSRVRQEW